MGRIKFQLRVSITGNPGNFERFKLYSVIKLIKYHLGANFAHFLRYIEIFYFEYR